MQERRISQTRPNAPAPAVNNGECTSIDVEMSERMAKFLRKNGEPAMNTNSGRCSLSKPKVCRNSLMNRASVISQTAPLSANTSHTGTFEKNSDMTAPISARLVKPK